MPASKLAKWFPGRVVKTRRDALKLTQSEVGRFIGRSYQTVAKWEWGEKCPDVGQVYALAELLRIPREIRDYMVEIARNEGRQNFQADRRFNALCLQMGELSNGEIWKWEPYFIPGIAQTRSYHFKIVGEAEGTTDAQLNRGWSFKRERLDGLRNRTDRPQLKLLVGELALINLRHLNKGDSQEQLDRLLKLDALPNWEIRIVTALHPQVGGAFESYRPNESEFGGPPFVYAEVWDNSWCIEESDRIARYDELWKVLWDKSTALKEYIDDRRDGLA